MDIVELNLEERLVVLKDGHATILTLYDDDGFVTDNTDEAVSFDAVTGDGYFLEVDICEVRPGPATIH